MTDQNQQANVDTITSCNSVEEHIPTAMMVDRIFLMFSLTWQDLWKAKMDVDAQTLKALKKLWIQKMHGFTMPTVSQAINSLIISGRKYPPELPEFYALCADLKKQTRLQFSSKQLEYSQRQTPEIAEYYKMVIKRVLKVKGGSGFPWLEKIEDATDEQLDLIRSDLGSRGIRVKPYAEFA